MANWLTSVFGASRTESPTESKALTVYHGGEVAKVAPAPSHLGPVTDWGVQPEPRRREEGARLERRGDLRWYKVGDKWEASDSTGHKLYGVYPPSSRAYCYYVLRFEPEGWDQSRWYYVGGNGFGGNQDKGFRSAQQAMNAGSEHHAARCPR